MQNQEKIDDTNQKGVDIKFNTDIKEAQATTDIKVVENTTSSALVSDINKQAEFINLPNNPKTNQKIVNYAIYLQIIDYFNKKKQAGNVDNQLESLDEQARIKWFEISTNVYNDFVLELNNNHDLFKQIIQDVFGSDLDKITIADDFAKEINQHENFIKQEKKRLKILSRKFFNVIILIFSCLLIGLPFLSIYFSNRTVIRNFVKVKADTDEKNRTLNQHKINTLNEIYTKQPTITLLNYYLSFFGVRILHEYNKLNIHNLLPNQTKNLCTVLHVLPFKIGGHIFINYDYCDEIWKPVETEGSVECSYETTEYDEDGDPYTTIEYETVYATHVEPTPFRERTNNVYTIFDETPTEAHWDLSSILKTKKKSKRSVFSPAQRRKTELSNVEFNQHYQVGKINQNDLKTLTIMNSYLTPYTQSTILKISQYYTFSKIYVSFQNGRFTGSSHFDSYSYCTCEPINQFLNYQNYQIGGSETIKQIKKICLKFINDLMFVPSILWAMDTAANNMLNFSKDYDWTIGHGYTDECSFADLETVISHATIEKCISTNQDHDAFRNRYFYEFDTFKKEDDVDIFFCNLNSYFTTDEVDIVPVMSVNCGVVDVPVPYIKYHDFTEPKVFFVYKNITSLLGTYPLSDFFDDKDLMVSLGSKINNAYLICTPELKIIVINDLISDEQELNELVNFIKNVNIIE